MKAFSSKTDEDIYIEYLNDWLTAAEMADNYGRSPEWMQKRIVSGYKQHKAKTEKAEA